MSIANYTDLQASVASWLHRQDLAAVIPDFIALAETKLQGDLESRSMEIRTTLTCTPGPTIAARYVALPTDMLEMKRLANVTADPVTVLEYRSPDEVMEENAYLLSSGQPRTFTVVGSNVELAPAPDKAYSLELVYIQKIPALSVSNTTNWLLTANPNAYLFGALLSSIAYTQDESRFQLWGAEYKKAIETTNSIDWYSGSTLRVKAR
jgi:hypothetical protein